jgi:hypothetical protein
VSVEFGLPVPDELLAGQQTFRKPAETVLAGVLDQVAAASLDDDTVIYAVPRQPGFEVRYRAVINDAEQIIWRQAAVDPSSPLGMNRLLLAQTVLAAKCTGILKDGEDVTDEHGRPVTFATPALQARLGVSDAEQAVQAFYGRDSDVLAASDELQRDAGWVSRPTKRR